MTNDLDALLAAVLDDPDDDTPRLVYADALEESGDVGNVARAEFIRLSVANEGEERQREILAEWLETWTPGRRGLVEQLQAEWWRVGLGVAVAIERGFVSAARLSDPLAAGGVRVPWTDTTPRKVSDEGSRVIALLIAENPLGLVVLEFGETEAWRLRRTPGGLWTAGWTRSNNLTRPPIEVIATADRTAFADQLARYVRSRLFEIGQRVIADQDGPF